MTFKKIGFFQLGIAIYCILSAIFCIILEIYGLAGAGLGLSIVNAVSAFINIRKE